MHHDRAMKRRLGAYEEQAAPRGMAEALECTWTYRPGGPQARPARHRVLPHTGVSLCYVARIRPDGRLDSGKLQVFGPLERPRMFDPDADVRLDAVRVKTEWARGLLGIEPGEVRNQIAPWSGARRTRALDRLRRRSSCSGRIDALLGLIEEAIAGAASADRPSATTRRVLELLRSPSDPGAAVGTIARSLGASERHLRRGISDLTALSPKRFQRIERLNRLVVDADRSAANERVRWADLAVRHGYCDQSHMIREVGELTGATPCELYAERVAERAKHPGGPPPWGATA